MALVTPRDVAEKLTSYLHHEIDLAALVDWAEQIMIDGELDSANYDVLREVISRLGVADVKAFGLTWEECEHFLSQLGYAVHIEVVTK